MSKAVKYGKLTLPGQWQTRIFLRYMNEATIKSLYDDYQAAKLKDIGSKEPTALETKVAEFYAKSRNKKETAKKFSMKEPKVEYIVKKVAVYKFLNK